MTKYARILKSSRPFLEITAGNEYNKKLMVQNPLTPFFLFPRGRSGIPQNGDETSLFPDPGGASSGPLGMRRIHGKHGYAGVRGQFGNSGGADA